MAAESTKYLLPLQRPLPRILPIPESCGPRRPFSHSHSPNSEMQRERHRRAVPKADPLLGSYWGLLVGFLPISLTAVLWVGHGVTGYHTTMTTPQWDKHLLYGFAILKVYNSGSNINVFHEGRLYFELQCLEFTYIYLRFKLFIGVVKQNRWYISGD